MDALQLRFPTSWEQRRPLMQNGVFYVPSYYKEHDRGLFPGFACYFDNTASVHLEYGSGNGEWVVRCAEEQPCTNWVAVEKSFRRVRKIHARKIKSGVNNLLIVAGEGLTFTQHYLSDSCLSAAYINFPDPWPKRRHAKHRLVRQPFVQELRRIIVKQGSVTFVTDHPHYKEQMEKEMVAWQSVPMQHMSYGSSYFERLWRSCGRQIHYMRYEND